MYTVTLLMYLFRELYSLVRFRLLIRYSKKATKLGQNETLSKKQH